MFRFDIKQLLWLTFFGSALLVFPEMLWGDADLSTHIAYGDALRAQGFPSGNPVLSSVNEPVILHEWLFECLVSGLKQLGGWGGPLWLGAVLYASLFGFAYTAMRRHGSSTWGAIGLVCWVFIGTRVHLTTRPHLFSWILMAVLVHWTILYAHAPSSPRKFIDRAFVLTVLWANLHGGFILAPLVVLIVGAAGLFDKQVRRASPTFIASSVLFLLAGLLTPYGINLYTHLLSFLSNSSIIGGTSDFQPLYTGAGLPYFVIATALTIGVSAFLRKSLRPWEWLFLGVFFLFALRSTRNLPYFAIASALIWSHAAGRRSQISGWEIKIRESSDRLEPEGVQPGWFWVGLVSLVSLIGLTRVSLPLDPTQVPVQSLAHLKDHPDVSDKPGFTTFMFGGYLLIQQDQVFIHPLNANYPPSLLDQYIDITQGDPMLLQTRFAWACLEADEPLNAALKGEDCWENVFENSVESFWRNRCYSESVTD